MPTHRTVRTLAVWLLVLAATASACSGDSPAVGPDAAPTSASASYTPPSRAPEVVPASTVDLDAATTFVITWFETLNYGFATGDADPLRTSTGLGCFTCANWITEIQSQADQDVRRVGGSVHVVDMASVAVAPGGRSGEPEDFVFRARLSRDAGALVAADGTRTPLDASQGEVVDLTVGLSTSSLTGETSWTMKSIAAPS